MVEDTCIVCCYCLQDCLQEELEEVLMGLLVNQQECAEQRTCWKTHLAKLYAMLLHTNNKTLQEVHMQISRDKLRYIVRIVFSIALNVGP